MNKKKLIKLTKWIAIMYILVGVVLYFSQEQFLFHGKKLDANYSFQFADQTIKEFNTKSANGENLNYVVFYPSDTNNIKGVAIYFHGNQANIARYAHHARRFTAEGMVVYMPDYPGFGKSTGKITEAIMKADAQTIYNIATNRYLQKPILLYGKSMGTGVASYLAANNAINYLVLETPYYSLPTIYDDFTWIYPTKALLKFQFNNYEMLPKVKAPIQIFHGTKDWLISIKNASKLKKYLKSSDEFVTIPGANHNNVADYQIYTDKLDSVLSIVTQFK